MLYNLLMTLGFQSAHQDMKQRCACPSCGFALGQKPGFEITVIGDRETFQQFSAKLSGQMEQAFSRERGWASCKLPSNFEQIDIRLIGIKRYVFAVGNDPFVPGLLNERAKPAQRPSQRTSWVVGDIPKQVAEPFAPVPPAAENQIGQQGTCLAGFGKVLLRRSFQNLKFSQHANRQSRHLALS